MMAPLRGQRLLSLTIPVNDSNTNHSHTNGKTKVSSKNSTGSSNRNFNSKHGPRARVTSPLH